MERNDEPIQEGTPLDKALFDKTNSRLELGTNFNIPVQVKENENVKILSFPDNKLDKYEVGQIVYLEYNSSENEEFSSRIFPVMTADNVEIDGFICNSTEGNYAHYMFNNDNSSSASNPSFIYFPRYIKPTQLYIFVYVGSGGSATYNCYGIRGDDSEELLYTVKISPGNFSNTVEINTPNFYKGIVVRVGVSGSVSPRETSINAGILGDSTSEQKYININNLGPKLINGEILHGKKYRLVYDGTVFNATEVTE